MSLKAYVVTDEWGDDGAVVVFAHHNVVARREGANELTCEFQDVSCKRKPEFDQYADTCKVPVSALLDDGWWINCAHCGRQAEYGAEDDDGNPLDLQIEGDHVFCRPGCQKDHHDEIESRRLREQDARQQVSEKFPGCQLIHLFHCYHPKRRNEHVVQATISFPGGKNSATWYVGDDMVSVAKMDEEAFQAYQNQRDWKGDPSS